MKVKKEFPGVTSDIAVGDYVNGHGTVVFVGRNSYGEVHFSYLDDYGELCSELYDTDFKVTLIREVETPDSVTVSSLFGTILRFSSSPGDSVEVGITNRTDLVEGLVFSAQELIDAIKTVKGLD